MNQATHYEPAIAFIGGSGLYQIDSLETPVSHHISTPYGDPSAPIMEGRVSGRRVCFLARHGSGHRLLAHEINHRANIWALRSLGVRWAVSITAVGSLREEFAPRHAVVPDQLVDRTGRAHEFTFFGNGIAAHVGFADPYSQALREILLEKTRAAGATVHDSGVYTCMNGPAFSTRAEAEMHRRLGFDLIGMTNAHEARLCREAEIAMAMLAFVTDYDCWKTDEAAVDVAAVIENLMANAGLAKSLIPTITAAIPSTPDWPEHRALDTAILTPREHWPEDRVAELDPILSRLAAQS
jgi:5'-methylthioadenosine phosphorylase